MLIDNIDKLYNTAGIIAVAIKTPGLHSDGISIRERDDKWGPVLKAALDLHAKTREERVRSIVGGFTIFTQSEGGQVAAVVVVSADAFIKSVHRTIQRMGKKSREASVEKASPRQARRDGSASFSSPPPTTDGRQRRAIQQEVNDERVTAPAIAHVHEMGGLVPSREEW